MFFLSWLERIAILAPKNPRGQLDEIAMKAPSRNGTCKRNTNDKLIFCRYRSEEKDSLSALNPCLCTHILFPIDLNAPKIETLKSLKNKNADLKLLASVSTDAVDHLNVSNASQGFLLGSSNSSADGIDVQIKRAAYLDEASKNKLLKSIQRRSTFSLRETVQYYKFYPDVQDVALPRFEFEAIAVHNSTKEHVYTPSLGNKLA
ncbi:hypothetical protein TNCV_2138841 [Trichonephila clavipes]|uniref:Uncharacterized protein n=1 Tax=Trichonephila clavipes TaxID=2585209 RepID=A0A8X6S1U8_TRICX|nr:hypothetical protein TNCV_2138841 [Trichonephila clavipes]